MEAQQKPKYRRDADTQAYNRYMAEVASYLAKVNNGRSVKAENPYDPRFSQPADDARLASRGQAPVGFGSTPKPQESFNPAGMGQAFTTPSGASPSYGFSNTYQVPPPQKAIGDIIERLQDPRNAWMGMGGTVGKFGRFMNEFRGPKKPDLGGFRPPSNVPDMKHLQNMNGMEEALRSPDPMRRALNQEGYKIIEEASPQTAEDINQILVGKQRLRDANTQAKEMTEGPPPDHILELFGLKKKK